MARRRSGPIAAPDRVSAPISIWPSAKGRRSSCRSPPARRRAARSRTPPSSTWPASSATPSRKGGFDGIMLDLHGAMVTESFEDGEGELLRRIRAIDPDTPDRRVARHARQSLRRDHRQRHNRHRLPHLPAYRHLRHRQARRRDPAPGDARRGAGRSWPGATSRCCRMSCGRVRTIIRTRNCRPAPPRWTSEGALAASLFTGFPHADITNAGLSAVVVTDGDRALAERSARRIARPGLGRPRGFRLPARTARTIAGARQVAGAAKARRGADRPARSLRQLRLGRHDGHDRRARRDPARGARKRRRLRDLRPGGRSAGDRRRDRQPRWRSRSAARWRCRRSPATAGRSR